MFYRRTSSRVFFIAPTVAFGFDENDLPFLEFAWLCFAFGVGAKDD